MFDLSALHLLLAGVSGLIMFYVMLKAVSQGAWVTALEQISVRRERETRQRAEDAAAEAAGRAAALEPLALNADGSVEEPIVAMVEGAA